MSTDPKFLLQLASRADQAVQEIADLAEDDLATQSLKMVARAIERLLASIDERLGTSEEGEEEDVYSHVSAAQISSLLEDICDGVDQARRAGVLCSYPDDVHFDCTQNDNLPSLSFSVPMSQPTAAG